MIIKNKFLRVAVVILFVAVEMTLGVLLQTAPGRTADVCRLGSVILCCLFCLLFMSRSRAYLLTQLAMICTVCADYLLVWVQPRAQLPAMLFFLVVQFSYATRLSCSDPLRPRRRVQWCTVVVLGTVVLLFTRLILGPNTDTLAQVSMLYYTVLVANVLFATIRIRSNPLLAIGLVLFLCCDTVIGLHMMGGYLPMRTDYALYRAVRPGFDLAWAFYLPSQVFITLSLIFDARKNK